MAVGNTFGATALSSYGGFWISFAIILTPGGFQITQTLEQKGPIPFYDSFGLYMMVSIERKPYYSSKADTPATGLVYLHIHPSPLHAQVHRGFLLPLFHS